MIYRLYERRYNPAWVIVALATALILVSALAWYNNIPRCDDVTRDYRGELVCEYGLGSNVQEDSVHVRWTQ